MTPDMTLGATQAVSLLSNGKSNPAPQEESKTPSSRQSEVAARENRPAPPADTVNLSPQLQQAMTDVQKKEDKKQDAGVADKGSGAGAAASKVEFVYDLKGDLITKYMDSANRLVYQTPSELMLRMQEAAAKSAAVDMKA